VTEAPVYSHTQNLPLCVILYGSALACFALAWIVGSPPVNVIPAAVALLIVVLDSAFHYLKVVDAGDRLAGPVCCRRVSSNRPLASRTSSFVRPGR